MLIAHNSDYLVVVEEDILVYDPKNNFLLKSIRDVGKVIDIYLYQDSLYVITDCGDYYIYFLTSHPTSWIAYNCDAWLRYIAAHKDKVVLVGSNGECYYDGRYLPMIRESSHVSFTEDGDLYWVGKYGEIQVGFRRVDSFQGDILCYGHKFAFTWDYRLINSKGCFVDIGVYPNFLVYDAGKIVVGMGSTVTWYRPDDLAKVKSYNYEGHNVCCVSGYYVGTDSGDVFLGKEEVTFNNHRLYYATEDREVLLYNDRSYGHYASDIAKLVSGSGILALFFKKQGLVNIVDFGGRVLKSFELSFEKAIINSQGKLVYLTHRSELFTEDDPYPFVEDVKDFDILGFDYYILTSEMLFAGDRILELPFQNQVAVAASSQGEVALIGEDNMLRIHDVDDLSRYYEHNTMGEGVKKVKFNPEGDLLYLLGSNVYVYDLQAEFFEILSSTDDTPIKDFVDVGGGERYMLTEGGNLLRKKAGVLETIVKGVKCFTWMNY